MQTPFVADSPEIAAALLLHLFDVLPQAAFQCLKVLGRPIEVVLVQVREFKCIFSQVEIIPQKQHQIAHELLIMKDSFLQHVLYAEYLIERPLSKGYI